MFQAALKRSGVASVKSGSDGNLSHLAESEPGRRGWYAAAGGLVAAVAIAVTLTGCAGGGGSSVPASAHSTYRPPPAGTYRLPAAAVSAVVDVPASALIASARAQLGRGQVSPPEKLPSNASQLSSGGRPEIMFICAEYWPGCAAERWALVMALSKFGTFTTLAGTTTAAAQASKRMPAFSFYGATYSSRYLTLASDELESNIDEGGGTYPLLQPPTSQEMNMISTWDRAPYTTTNASLPFAYMGGKFLLTTAQYDASATSGMSFQAAANVLTSGTSTVSRRAEAAAGYLVADICTLTHHQPAQICSQVPSGLTAVGKELQYMSLCPVLMGRFARALVPPRKQMVPVPLLVRADPSSKEQTV